MTFSPKILVAKKAGKNDSFFYDGEIATVTKPNGTVLSLSAEGEIRVAVRHRDAVTVYKNRQVEYAIEKHRLNDSRLRRLEREGRLEWLNNNWFEVAVLRKGANVWECDEGCNVAHTYDDAIQLLKNYYENPEY